MVDKHNEQAIQDTVAENYEYLRHALPYASIYHQWWLSQMADFVPPEKRAGLILDNGCGIGLLFEAFPAARVVGLDLSSGMLNKARQRGSRLLQADSTKLPFPDETFDIVFARSLLHHLPEPQVGAAEMHRVLRQGGLMILADTNRSLLSTLPRLIAYRGESFSESHQNFSREQYFAWLKAYFALERVQYFGYLAYPFGFPDMMGPLRKINYPLSLVRALIAVDQGIARIPLVRTQSWGLMVVARKTN